MESFREKLKNEHILFDGAIGTEVRERLNEQKNNIFILNRDNPSIIRDIHRDYVKAGAQAIMTNTLTANSVSVLSCGYSLEEIISEGVKVAREAAGENAFVVQTIGPLEYLLKGKKDETTIEECFKECAVIGEKIGVDGYVIETIYNLKEMVQAVSSVRETSEKGIVATMVLDHHGMSFDGKNIEEICIQLEEAGADAIGINCMKPGEHLLNILRDMRRFSKLPLVVQGNLGLKDSRGNKSDYEISSKEYIEFIREAKKIGVEHVGGCCGTTPRMIEEIKHQIL